MTRKRRKTQRGSQADQRALRAHERRIRPTFSDRYQVRTYGLRMAISEEAVNSVNWFNLSNRHYLRNGKRGGARRRYEPYWGER